MPTKWTGGETREAESSCNKATKIKTKSHNDDDNGSRNDQKDPNKNKNNKPKCESYSCMCMWLIVVCQRCKVRSSKLDFLGLPFLFVAIVALSCLFCYKDVVGFHKIKITLGFCQCRSDPNLHWADPNVIFF